MSVHRIAAEHIPETGEIVAIEGEEAHHALRVKRVVQGETLELLDGRGIIARGRVEGSEKIGKRDGWRLMVRVMERRSIAPDRPRLEVFGSTPKGPRVEEMIDQLSQVGVAAWHPLRCARTEVDPRAGKMGRLVRHAAEACKQCGRAWTMEIGTSVGFEEALRAPEGTSLVIGHVSGGAYVPTGAEAIRLLIGPVGDFTDGELARAREAGASIVKVGPHVMRIETATLAASAVILDHERRAR
ncbi:MAG: 16S rRNA (uracil(1498)-N(3))-methyltransferase [Phycisphaeraceae bacterium]|nr:16S rRNA (uracil(1498)-N(3))-methyltransferase [Phycisphaeraceae bacterium]